MTAITKVRKGWSIGELARRTGCPVDTIRFYERSGLLPRPPRTESGHRLYGREDVRRVRFVRRARALDFTLDEVRQLLQQVEAGAHRCAEVREQTAAHLEVVRRKMADLRRLERTLADVVAQCDNEDADACPVLDQLSAPSA